MTRVVIFVFGVGHGSKEEEEGGKEVWPTECRYWDACQRM